MAFVIGDKLIADAEGQRESFAVVATTANNTTPLEAGRYLVTASTNCFVTQGDAAVESSATEASAFLLAGEKMVIAVDGPASAHVAAIRVSADGRLFIQKITPAFG